MNSAMTMRAAPRPLVGRKFMLAFLGLLLVGALFLALSLISQLIGPLLSTVPLPNGARPLLVVTLLQQQGIVLSAGLSTLIMLCALLVRLAPLTWWMYLLTAFRRQPDPALARTMAWVQAQQAQAQAQPQATVDGAVPTMEAQAFVLTPGAAPDPALAPTVAPGPAPAAQAGAAPPAGTPPAPGVPGTPGAPGAPPPATLPPGTPPAAPGTPPAANGQPVPPGAPGAPVAPGQQPPAAAPAPNGQPAPGAPPIAGQPPLPTLQQALAPTEELNLEALTSVDDILSSAFNDDEEVDAQLLALSERLEEVEMVGLVKQTRQINKQLRELAIAEAT